MPLTKREKIRDLLIECNVLPEEANLAALKLLDMDTGKFAALCARRMADFPDWVSIDEGRIIGKILDTALADPDIMIQVHDECELMLAWTRDRSAIEKETAQTGSTYYDFSRGGVGIGYVWLIHGNECDVISDCTDNEQMEKLLKPASELADQMAGAA